MVVSGINSPLQEMPNSSSNSRLAASKGSSSSVNSPLGIDQAPKSFFAQNGPPGWTKKTSKKYYFKMRNLLLFFSELFLL